MAYTLDDNRQYLRDYNRDASDARAYRLYDRIANDAQYEFHRLGELDSARRKTRLSLAAAYSTGTVSVSAGGTAVTGSGTTFTAAMVGRYIRFNGEAQSYLIATYSSATSITIEAYLGSSNLSAVTYEITEDRKALPTRCRSIIRVLVDTPNQAYTHELEPVALDQMEMMRLARVGANLPQFYATEYTEPASGNIPAGYVWVYPAASTARILTLTYMKWPAVMTTTTDEFALPAELESPLRMYTRALLLEVQGDTANAFKLKDEARREAMRAISATRQTQESTQRDEWDGPDCSGDDDGYWPRLDSSVITAIS